MYIILTQNKDCLYLHFFPSSSFTFSSSGWSFLMSLPNEPLLEQSAATSFTSQIWRNDLPSSLLSSFPHTRDSFVHAPALYLISLVHIPLCLCLHLVPPRASSFDILLNLPLWSVLVNPSPWLDSTIILQRFKTSVY